MARFFGKVGYVFSSIEVRPGIYEEAVIEREYYGDVIRDSIRADYADTVLPNTRIGNNFSVLADAYAFENLNAIRYINWSGANWTITRVEDQRPRLFISVGEEYHGPTP